MEDACAMIQSLCRQEERKYWVRDINPKSPNYEPHLPYVVPIEYGWRKKIVSWCYEVVDFCKLNRETIEIALNYLDRFTLNTSAGRALQHSRSLYQLAGITALYTAVKVHEPAAMDLNLVTKLSKGACTAQQVEKMERLMLSALKWLLNPPTSMYFVRMYMDLLLPESMQNTNADMKALVLDHCKFQIELILREDTFICVKSCDLAYCALMNALEHIKNMSDEALRFMASQLAHTIGNGNPMKMHILAELQTQVFWVVLSQPQNENINNKKRMANQQQSTATHNSSGNEQNNSSYSHNDKEEDLSHYTSPRTVDMMEF